VTIAPTGRTIWLEPTEGARRPEALVESEFNLDEPQVSPDGHWITYQSNETDRWEVFVEPLHQHGEKVRVSSAGGAQPLLHAQDP
jgi:eukaryotic-like serine/threonine-protein kinase